MRNNPIHFPAFVVSLWLISGISHGRPPERSPASEQPEKIYRMLTTPEGVRFGVRGNNGGSRAPVAFLFGSLLHESLTAEHCRILLNLGFVCVALDAPGHGADRVAGEPPELRSWRHRLEAEKNFVATFNQKLSGVLDYLVAERVADPARVVAVGGSCGGFLAFHFAASDTRVNSVAGLAPVTDLRVLTEFQGMEDHPLAQLLAPIRHAERLAGRSVLVIVGDRDDRVGTDHAVAFARRVSRVATTADVELHVLPEPRGHAHPAGTNHRLKDWARKCLEAPASPARVRAALFVFNSDGGAAAIAHVKGQPVRDVVCRELNELEGTAITDFFWCPIVGGNVFIYPTNVGERIGDNIRDWDRVHPYYREQGRAMAANLSELIKGGDDPIEMLAARAKELGIRFWLSCRMNEIHEDDDRFMVVRSLFKEKHSELLHGKNYHSEAVYAPQNGWSYAWDYSRGPVREHFLALFREWLQYDISGIELDYCRSPCLFPPGEEKAGAPLLTDFMTKLKSQAQQTTKQRGHDVKIAVRVPPSVTRCGEAGIDIKTWIERGLVDVVTPMDQGYLDPDPQLAEFIELAKPKGVLVLGGIEPKVRDYQQTSRQTFAVATSFLHQGADGLYLFNYDCHRMNARSSEFGGVLQDYTPEEKAFLTHANDPAVLGNRDKHYLISHDTASRLADDGGTRPLLCRLPVGEPKAFTITVGDDLKRAAAENRILSSRLVVTLKDCTPQPDELHVEINGENHGPDRFRFETLKPSGIVEITVTEPPMHRGTNRIRLGLKPGSRHQGVIRSIDFHIDYASIEIDRAAISPAPNGKLPVMGSQQLFAYVP